MRFKPYLLAGLSGVLYFFLFPNILGVHLWPLAWLFMVPLFFGLREARSAGHAALISGCLGLTGYPTTFHWLIHTFHVYAGMGYGISIFVLFAMALTLSAFLGLFGIIRYKLENGLGVPPLLSAPAAWTAIELLRGHVPFGGFPWAFLAHSQYKFLPIIQMTDVFGVYGLTFLIVLVNASLAHLLARGMGLEGSIRVGSAVPGLEARVPSPAPGKAKSLKAALLPAAPALLLFLLALAYGQVRIKSVDAAFAGRPEIKIGVVQANVDQAVKWERDNFYKSLDDHLDLTRGLMAGRPRLVIWPEAAITVGNFNEHWERRSFLIDYISGIDAYLLTGSLSVRREGEKRYGYNSAYLLSPFARENLGRYDKTHLVPFGEYVPYASLFFFADAIAQGNTGSTTPGEELKIFPLPDGYFGCVICYEVIFPDINRKLVNKGAVFMTTITNDAWFGKTGAPYQHHAAVVFRAVENRVYYARAANTGVSSIVDPVGRIIVSTPIYEKASFNGSVKTSSIHSIYTRIGDVFAWIVFGLVCMALVYERILRRRKEKEDPPKKCLGG